MPFAAARKDAGCAECTPPSLTSPMRCNRRARPRSIASRKSGWRKEFPTRNQLVHTSDVHLHDSSGSNVQMAHFAIAHLPFGQANVGSGSMNQRVGEILQQPVIIRFACQRSRCPSFSARYPQPSSTVSTIGFGLFPHISPGIGFSSGPRNKNKPCSHRDSMNLTAVQNTRSK